MPEPWRLEMGIITASDGTLFMQQMAENDLLHFLFVVHDNKRIKVK